MMTRRVASGWRFRFLTSIALIAMLVVAPIVPAHTGASCGSVKGSAKWRQFQTPAFSDGEQEVAKYDVSPGAIAITNGREVYRSIDGGCRFKRVLSLATFGSPTLAADHAEITQLAVAPKNPSQMYVAVAALTSPAGAPLPAAVFYSTNGGRTWSEAEGLSEAQGTPVALAIAPSDPRVAYMLVATRVDLPEGIAVRQATKLFMTTDGGSWTMRYSFEGGAEGIPSSPAPPGAPYTGLTVDPKEPKELWIYSRLSAGGVAESLPGILWTRNINSGKFREWKTFYGPVEARASAIHILRQGNKYVVSAIDPTGYANVHDGSRQQDWSLFSPIGGWSRDTSPIRSLVLGNKLQRLPFVDPHGGPTKHVEWPDQYAFSTDQGKLYYHDPEKPYLNEPALINPKPAPMILDLKGWSSGEKMVIFGHDGKGTFYRWQT